MSLIPQNVKQVLGAVDTRVMDQQINSSGQRWLREGTHRVKVSDVDLSKIGEGKVIFVFADPAGQTHRDMMDLVGRDNKTGVSGMGWRFRDTLGALIPSTEAYDAFLAEVHADNASVFGMLTDMECSITLARSVGNKYGPAEPQDGGGYVSRDTKTGEVLAKGSTIDELLAACKVLESRGYKKSFINTTRISATAGQENLALFSSRIGAYHAPKQQAPAPRVVAGYKPRTAA